MLNFGTLKKMYYDMVLIRRFEESVNEYSQKGVIPGFVHLGIGQEASQVGMIYAMKESDYKYPDHRCHGATLLLGTDRKSIMAEIFGRSTGINGGRGGSMHIADIDVRNLGNNGIQGSNIVAALGTAFYAHYKEHDDITLVVMGDGTLGEGACHESMNLAASWKLPLLYILVNNQYAISTHYTSSFPHTELSNWTKGYNVPGETVDGNDVEAVYEAVKRSAEYVRQGNGPALVELMTYRWQGHFAGDPAAYRPDEEVDDWVNNRCPIKRLRNKLMEHGVSNEELDRKDTDASAEVQEMVEFALNSPFPKAEDAMLHVYSGRKVEVHNV